MTNNHMTAHGSKIISAARAYCEGRAHFAPPDKAEFWRRLAGSLRKAETMI